MPSPTSLFENEHPIFMSSFDELTRRDLLEEDTLAWKIVCSVLIAIVSLGLLLGVCALLLAV